MDYPPLPQPLFDALHRGAVIPAHPLALDLHRRWDERRQRALTRYYHAAGANGVAVGVHTTQFEIRKPEHGLYHPLLELTAATLAECDAATQTRLLRIAGVCGQTTQAVHEAATARETGYDAVLLSLSALAEANIDTLIGHCDAVARQMPLIGFYLQPAAGGRLLPISFWRRFVTLPNVVAIKIAPFNRYQTLEVIRAVAEAGRAGDIALYTGNDDQIVLDLLSRYRIETDEGPRTLSFAGGLLGHWACWTSRAVRLLEDTRELKDQGNVPIEWFQLAAQVTDCNAALFDAANGFAGCIAGIQEVLRRQRLLETNHCLDPANQLSPGQSEEIDRIYRSYPHLNDDQFVAEHRDEWLRD